MHLKLYSICWVEVAAAEGGRPKRTHTVPALDTAKGNFENTYLVAMPVAGLKHEGSHAVESKPTDQPVCHTQGRQMAVSFLAG